MVPLLGSKEPLNPQGCHLLSYSSKCLSRHQITSHPPLYTVPPFLAYLTPVPLQPHFLPQGLSLSHLLHLPSSTYTFTLVHLKTHTSSLPSILNIPQQLYNCYVQGSAPEGNECPLAGLPAKLPFTPHCPLPAPLYLSCLHDLLGCL